MCHLNLCIKKWGSSSSFRRKRPFTSPNSAALVETYQAPKVRALITQKMVHRKGCAVQLIGITKSRKIVDIHGVLILEVPHLSFATTPLGPPCINKAYLCPHTVGANEYQPYRCIWVYPPPTPPPPPPQ